MPRFAVALLLIAGIATAAHAQQPDAADAREKELQQAIKSFRLELLYHGQEEKPFCRLILSVPPLAKAEGNPFFRFAQVTEEQASRIIACLGAYGFLTRASDLRDKTKPPPPAMPGYTLQVGQFYEDLGWDLLMLKRLEGLRKVVGGDAAKEMDLLLGRLSGLRQQWEKEDIARQAAQPLVILTGTDSHIKQPSCHRIMSQDEWITIWQRHKGVKESKDYDLFYNRLGLPYVDFAKCMVIAVFQGSGWNSAGLRVATVLEEKDKIVLRFEDNSYQTAGSDGGGERVAVYGFFVLPQSNKTVVLEENVQRYLGHPPVWKERVHLPK
jgi:hypothetical protein